MNADEIALLCNALSINEKDRTVHTLDANLKVKGEKRLTLCLVGNFLKKKLVNIDIFVEVMNKIRRVNGGVEIESVEGNIFAFYFNNMEDMQLILRGAPWTFDQAIIVFDRPVGAGEIRDVKFMFLDFWVQIHNIPLICMTKKIEKFLGGMIGKVHDVDLVSAADGSGCFLRVRITVETNQPLQRCLRVDLLGDGKVTTMLLRYERLQVYYFKCDRISHKMDECAEECDDRDMSLDINRKLGIWLRAFSPPKRSFKGSSKVDYRSWGKSTGSGGFKTSGDIERRSSGPWRAQKSAMAAVVSGEEKQGRAFDNSGRLIESCGGNSGMPGRLEESSRLVLRSGCREAEVDTMSGKTIIDHGKNTIDSSRPSPNSKNLIMDSSRGSGKD
ncbi:hypothetical protein LWI28_016823 [Acer negundo]|uniref:DUF4283 domain-containing protein n=1 Tax=Acer negundo TaxID=4023 RepID=A0AAD5JDB9_ACENE|nr:hypothetical protein LWI28_016823 [Acer negundo]